MGARKKIVVLGANSFSGQDFVDLLLDHPDYEVIGISRSTERSVLFLKYKLRSELSRYRYHALDLNRDLNEITQLLDAERPEAIVNFASQSEVAPSWDHPEHWYQTNCVALAGLVNHLRRQTYLQRFLQISSPEVYGTCHGQVMESAPMNPSTPYAASKASADALLNVYREQFEFPVLKVRATNVYGARQQLFKIIPRSVIYLHVGRTIELHGGGTAVKSYIHIRDVSTGEWMVLENGKVGETYHLSPESGISVKEIVKRICARIGRDFETAAVSRAERLGQDAAYVIDSSKARMEFGWRPRVSLEEGLGEVIDWVAMNWKEIRQQPLDYVHKP